MACVQCERHDPSPRWESPTSEEAMKVTSTPVALAPLPTYLPPLASFPPTRQPNPTISWSGLRAYLVQSLYRGLLELLSLPHPQEVKVGHVEEGLLVALHAQERPLERLHHLPHTDRSNYRRPEQVGETHIDIQTVREEDGGEFA